eukprot:SAG31_NODE_2823_length_5038_cov_3.257340_5_plen_176_part_00
MPANRVGKSLWKSVEGEEQLLDPTLQQHLVDLFTTEGIGKKDKKEKKKAIETVPTFLDPKRANNVGILISRFKLTFEAVATALDTDDSGFLTYDNLEILRQVLPTAEELDMIRTFDGNIDKVGKAEQFMIATSRCDAASSRVQARLLMFRFPESFDLFKPDLRDVEAVCITVPHD